MQSELRETDQAATKALINVADSATSLPIGSPSDNLKVANAGDTYEYTDMNPGMAKPGRSLFAKVRSITRAKIC